MAEPDNKPPEPVPVAAGMSMKMVIIIVAGTLVLGMGGAFALFKLMAGGHSGDEHKAEEPVAKAAGHGEARRGRARLGVAWVTE